MSTSAKIRKDDLDALGGIAGLVGAYMNEFAQGADPDARRRLFRTNMGAKETIKRALQTAEGDYAQNVVPDPTEILIPSPVINSEYINTPVPIEPNTEIQMEFNFVNQVIQGYGSVQDVIKHFDKRLDNIEEDIKIIKSQMKDILSILNTSISTP